MSLTEELFAYLESTHPRSLGGVREAREVAPERFDAMCELFLDWGAAASGDNFIPGAVDAFVDFSNDVLMEQARYERRGTYKRSTFAECEAEVYGKRDVMDHYLWGAYLTNFLWAHHVDIAIFFEDRFLRRVAKDAKIVEIAPGHGQFGIWALTQRPGTTLRGFDISPSSMVIANKMAAAAGVADKAVYERRDAMDLDQMEPDCADVVICSFLVEHLEQPHKLYETIGRLLKPGGVAFTTGALTAAHADHIFEFKRESELLHLAEDHGLRVLESLSIGPSRTLPRAKQLPRSMAMLLQRRKHDHW